MTTKIGLISDVHASVKPLKQALQIFEKNAVDKIFCAGDIAGYGSELNKTIKQLVQSECVAISGNHDLWFLHSGEAKTDVMSANYLSSLERYLKFNIEGKDIYMVHAHPPDFDQGGIKLLNVQGDINLNQKAHWCNKLKDFNFDILIVGHTHQIFAEKMGHLLVVNPGSTCFNHSCAILYLPEMRVEFIALSGKAYTKVWNWGKFLTE